MWFGVAKGNHKPHDMLANYYNYKMKNVNYLIIIIAVFIYFIQAPRASEARASSANHVFPVLGEFLAPNLLFRLAEFPIKASRIPC